MTIEQWLKQLNKGFIGAGIALSSSGLITIGLRTAKHGKFEIYPSLESIEHIYYMLLAVLVIAIYVNISGKKAIAKGTLDN